MNQRIRLSIIAVTGVLLFSAYAHAEAQAQKKSSPSAEQPPQQELPNKTKQKISFKGIPLGKPGITKDLQKMCLRKKFNTIHDRCSFTDEKSTILLDYETLVDSFALVTLSSDKAVVKVVIDGSTEQMLTLAKALEKQYGAPLKKKTIVKKEVGTEVDQGTFVMKEAEGAQLDKETFTWVDEQGSRITVESVYFDFDKGGVAIEAPSLAAQGAAEKKAK